MRMTFLKRKPMLFLLIFTFLSFHPGFADTPDPNLTVSVNDQIICIGEMVDVEVLATELMVDYQLLIDGNPVGLSQAGTGGTLVFNSPPINGDAVISVSATDIDATVNLSSFPIEVDTVLITGTAIGETTMMNDGEISICVESGIGPFDITVSPGDVTIRMVEGACLANYAITGLASGSYTVTITDAESCSDTKTYTIAQGICTQVKIANVEIEQPVSCFGANDGIIKITLEKFEDITEITIYPGGGLASQTFTNAEIGDGSVFLTDLPIGDYDIIAVDQNGCQVSYLFNPANIFGPENPLEIEYTSIDASATNDDGKVDICLNGGNRVYSPSIVPEAGTITNSSNNSCDGNFEITGLAAGSYTVFIQDGAACLDSFEIVINPSTCAFKIESVELDTVCAGSTGRVGVVTSGGDAPYTFDFGSGEATQSISTFAAFIASHQEISFTATDNNGCIVTYSKPISLVLKSDIQTDICITHVQEQSSPSGQIEICVTGGTAPYSVSIVGPVGSPVFTNTPNTGCRDYFLLNNLIGGTYIFAITDAEGCNLVDRAVVLSQTCPSFAVDSININDIKCNGDLSGSIEVYTTGGLAPYEYFLTNYNASVSTMGDYVFDGLDTGAYYLHVKDAAGCIAPFASKIEVQRTEGLNTSFTFLPPCPGESNGEICLTPAGGEPGFDYNAVFDDNPKTVIEAPGPNCNGTFHIPDAEMGIYCIELLDTFRCRATGVVALEEEAVLVTAETVPACDNQNIGSIDVNVSGGIPAYTYAWETGESTEDLEDLLPGNYQISVTDTRGCETILPITVEEYAITLSTDINPNCNDQTIGAINVSTAGGILPYTFTWDTGADTEDLTGLAAGTYTLDVVDANGCMISISPIVEQYTMAVAVDEQGTCEGENAGSLTANPTGGIEPYSYVWSNGSVAMANTPLAAGDYTVNVFDSNGCQVPAAGTVASFDTPSVTIDGDAFIPLGESSNLNAVVAGGTGPFTYQWSPTNILSNSTVQNPSAFPGQSTNVSVLVTDANGCTASALIAIQVFSPPVMPTGFTPNMDGNNDLFEPIFRGFELDITLFQIFDRWGKKVYEATSAAGWDGKYNSTDQPIGTYVYFLEYQDPEGTRENLKGQVTLLR